MAVSPNLPNRSERESISYYADALAKEKILRLQLGLGATSLLLFATLVVGGFAVPGGGPSGSATIFVSNSAAPNQLCSGPKPN